MRLPGRSDYRPGSLPPSSEGLLDFGVFLVKGDIADGARIGADAQRDMRLV